MRNFQELRARGGATLKAAVVGAVLIGLIGAPTDAVAQSGLFSELRRCIAKLPRRASAATCAALEVGEALFEATLVDCGVRRMQGEGCRREERNSAPLRDRSGAGGRLQSKPPR